MRSRSPSTDACQQDESRTNTINYAEYVTDPSGCADKYRAVAGNYLDALAQFMTPGDRDELVAEV